MSSVARAVWLDRLFTSLATTAKPFPASPARAASMVALRARRLVCLAIASMVETISAMRSEATDSSPTRIAAPSTAPAICSMRATASCTVRPPSSVTACASPARAATSRLRAQISWMPVTVSSVAAAMPWDS